MPKNEDWHRGLQPGLLEACQPDRFRLAGGRGHGYGLGKVCHLAPPSVRRRAYYPPRRRVLWIIEPERWSWQFEGLQDTAEAMTKFVIRYKGTIAPMMAFFNSSSTRASRVPSWWQHEAGRITYTEAIEILKKNNKKVCAPVEWA